MSTKRFLSLGLMLLSLVMLMSPLVFADLGSESPCAFYERKVIFAFQKEYGKKAPTAPAGTATPAATPSPTPTPTPAPTSTPPATGAGAAGLTFDIAKYKDYEGMVCTAFINPIPISTLGLGDKIQCIVRLDAPRQSPQPNVLDYYGFMKSKPDAKDNRICAALLTPSGFSSLEAYIQLGIGIIFNVSLVVAVLMIIFGGIQTMLSGPVPEQKAEGEKNIRNAVVGLLMLFAFRFILYFVNPTFFQ